MIGWPGSRALVTDTAAPILDMDACVGQGQASFRFELVNGVTGEHLGEIHPLRSASLRHDTGQTIKRQLTFPLGTSDTAAINTLTDRVAPFMTIPGAPNPARADGDWPLGRYMWADNSRRLTTAGRLSSSQLSDEMLLVDQQVTRGISGVGRNVMPVILDVVSGLPVELEIEPSPYVSADAWGIGTGRGQMLEALSVAGDYWSPWFAHDGKMHWLRTFDPARRVVDLDLDVGNRVIRDSIVETDDLLTSPNTIIVVSNAPANGTEPVVGIATVPPSAPNSVANRGFAIPKTENLQITDSAQAQAVADGLIQRQAIFEMVTLSTPADPRHDSYNVIRWQGANWLELSWSMPMVYGAAMTHTMRRSYR